MPAEEKDIDRFEEERLDTTSKNKEFKKAKNQNPETFKSFSEGLASIDKFGISGLNDKEEPFENLSTSDSPCQSAKETPEKEMSGDSFQSFSDGLEAVEKFEITGAEQEKPNVLQMPLADYLNHPACLFAYPLAKGRSKTILALLERINLCAWMDQISVHLHKEEHPTEYEFLEKRIHLDLSRPYSNQLFDLAHQIYHCAHRYLVKLYANEPLSEELFVDTWIWSEAGALICELNVKKELRLKDSDEISFKIEAENEKYQNVYLEPILASGGAKELRRILARALHKDDFIYKRRLTDILKDNYKYYLANFDSDREEAKSLITKSVEAGIASHKI